MLTEDQYDDHFAPLESPGQQQGSHLWDKDEVDAALAAGSITERQVWTVVDDGDTQSAAAGWHHVNRYAYHVTERPWVTGDEVVTLVDWSTFGDNASR